MRKLGPFICLLFILVACHPDLLQQAKNQIKIGMTREEAIEILSDQTWYHQPCENQYGITDLFFYGSRRYDKAGIVIVDSAKKDGTFEVVQISSFEPYAWHAAYADCIQRDRFEH